MNSDQRTDVESTRQDSAPAPSENRLLQWLRNLGLAGFLFFTVKGLLWILVPYLIAKRFFSGQL